MQNKKILLLVCQGIWSIQLTEELKFKSSTVKDPSGANTIILDGDGLGHGERI
jgi:hypothetical protein